ncbi:hypothetical protein [Rhodococcus sp. NCIMB 12038]|uniref:hypothetical protein n=1 Tax=Rhodococcus sp. NCIMB 12038 TaxID=933800 RepID=UPI00211AE94D|nr:hypothetical protein [Rhodococcus sp. NCIMB 12038]
MGDSAVNVKQLNLANLVSVRLSQLGDRYQAASHLVSSAAFQVGFVRLAAGMAEWAREPDGHKQMQERLSNEQFNILMLAPVDYASRTAMTCLDLCAAAAYRLRKSGQYDAHGGRESDLDHLRNAKSHGVRLHAEQERWRAEVTGSAARSLLKRTRDIVTHRPISEYSIVGSDQPTTSIEIDGQRYDGVALTSRFARFAETQYEAFVQAVLADFPTNRTKTTG